MRMDVLSSLTGIGYSSDPLVGHQIGNTLVIDKLVFEYPTGFQNEKKPVAFTIFPNPSSHIVTVTVDMSNNLTMTLNIYNLPGALVRTETLKQAREQIRTDDLSDGIYMMEIKSGSFSAKQKLIIRK